MNRVLVLALYMTRDLFRSLAGVVPPVLTLGVYQATFYYGGKVDYFAAVGGADLCFVCLVTTLLFASRANRAATYPLLARSSRTELIAAIALSSFAVTIVMSILFVSLIIWQTHLSIALTEWIAIASRWLILWGFTIALGLNMGKLVSRGGSYLIVTGIVAIMVTVSEQRVFLLGGGYDWLVNAVSLVAAPVTTLLTAPVAESAGNEYVLSAAATITFALALYVLAAWLLRRKDLLWTE